MAFIQINDLPGKVYVPDPEPGTCKKNKCPDCFSCQMCSDSRCRVCLNHHRSQKLNSCSCGQIQNEKSRV